MEILRSNSLEIALQAKRGEISGKTLEFERISKEVADRIREYSKLQVSLWKQIPNLALEAQGRSGYSDFSVYEDEDLMITLREGEIGEKVHNVCIQLRSGEIRSPAPGGFESTSDENVCAFLRHLDFLNAKTYVETLKIQAQRPYMVDRKQAEEWRAHIRQQKGWPAITPKDLEPEKLTSQEAERVKELLKENF